MEYFYELEKNGARYSFVLKEGNRICLYVNDEMWGEPQRSSLFGTVIAKLKETEEENIMLRGLNYYTCSDCKHYSQCSLTGFEDCSKNDDGLPSSKVICKHFIKENSHE